QEQDAILLLERRHGTRIVRQRRQLAGVDIAIDRLALLAHAPIVVDAQIAADTDQPCLEVRAPIEGVERLEDLEEDVLRQILRLDHDLVCDGLPLAAIAAGAGTPVYVYSAALVRERYRAIDEAFGGYPHALHYALKANSTLAIARLLRSLGSAVDANSVWEIE